MRRRSRCADGELHVPLPHELVDSDAYHADPSSARQLWDDGYRPTPAEQLRRGDVVAYRETDVFRCAPVGPTLAARVLHVSQVDGLVSVEHSGGDTELDELDECWVLDSHERTSIEHKRHDEALLAT